MQHQGETSRLLAGTRRRRPFMVALRGTGKYFANGLSSQYDSEFPTELEGVMDAADFDKAVKHVNRILTDYWPCPACYWFGMCCAPCTAGCSLLPPFYCVREAEAYAVHQVGRLNSRACFTDAGVTWRLHKGCFWSQLEIHVAETHENDCDTGESTKVANGSDV